SYQYFNKSIDIKNNEFKFLRFKTDSLLNKFNSLKAILEAQREDGEYNRETVTELEKTVRAAQAIYFEYYFKVDSLNKIIAHANVNLDDVKVQLENLNDSIDRLKKSIGLFEQNKDTDPLTVLSLDSNNKVDHKTKNIRSFLMELPESALCLYENQFFYLSIVAPQGKDILLSSKGFLASLPRGNYSALYDEWKIKITKGMNTRLPVPINNMQLFSGFYTFILKNEAGRILYKGYRRLS